MSPVNTTRHVQASVAKSASSAGFSRRDALRLLAAQMAVSLAGCSKPVEEIVPYVEMPEGLVPGVPLKYATALPLGGYGRGVIVTSIDGRPIKVEGNPRHPASRGSTDVFAEAEILSLYDPDRSKTVLQSGQIASWESFRQALQPASQPLSKDGGAGLRLLTRRVTSPTLARQIDALLKTYPQAKWCVHEPVGDDAERRGAALAFGQEISARPQLEKVKTILALDADPLGPGPDQIRNGRDYAAHRSEARSLSRLYVMESAPTLTGAKADNRIALHPDLIAEAAIAVANTLGAGLRTSALPAQADRFVAAAVKALQADQGRAIVLGGRAMQAEIQAVVHWINNRLAAPVDYIAPVDAVPGHTPASLDQLARDLDAGSVELLLVLEANPLFDAAADLDFGAKIKRARICVHAGLYADETAALAHWHLPLSHALESWSDIRARDGTASIAQPLIRPLYGTRTAHEVLAVLTGQPDTPSYDLVRQTWAETGGANFDDWWMRVLHDGVIPNSASKALTLGEPKLPPIGPAVSASANAAHLTLVLQPDPCVFDGTFANNAWLQELPKPLTKQVWGNALALSSTEAAKRALHEGDVVKIEANERSIEVPIVISPGHADGVASLTLGYGRRGAGKIGTNVGANAYALRASHSPWLIADAQVTRTGGKQPILKAQNVVGPPEDVDKLFPILSAAKLAEGQAPPLQTGTDLPTLFRTPPLPDDGHAWGMVIDTAACIGCNACVIACQAENNVPVVGPEEIAQGRQMHWLRIDVYDHGTTPHPKLGFQPVPCMHCEQAPCEPVCPVAASVHDSEGLNVQVYNRCIGTRFCEANCPYKVRRFNFFGYADGQEYANLGLEPYKAQKNPEVTVRARGVMEKCTYCVQRISGARRAGERDSRPIGTDEVTTACQGACPTRAITFGDLHQSDSAVNRLKRDARNYALLAHLGTRPRTTYLAEIRNSDPDLTADRA